MSSVKNSSQVVTRRRTAHFILGQPSDLPANMLPLEVDVFNKYQKIKEENPNLLAKEIAKKLSEEIVQLWKEKGNIPTVSTYSVQKMVENIQVRGKNILKIPKERREQLLTELEEEKSGEKNSVKGRKRKHFDLLDQLFDVASCKHKSREDCNCPAEKKVPNREFEFLSDQRSDRKMMISSVDDKVTALWRQKEEKITRQETSQKKEKLRQENKREVNLKELEELMEIEVSFDMEEKEDSISPETIKISETKQNRMNIPKFAAELDRYQISDCAGAALATALLEDIGVISTDSF